MNPQCASNSYKTTRASPQRMAIGYLSVTTVLFKTKNHLLLLLLDGLDDTDSDGLAHVTHGKAAEGSVLRKGLDAHALGGHELDHGGITGLDELGLGLENLTGTAVHLGLDLRELARNVRGVAVKHGRVSVADLTGVVEHDDLGVERGGGPGGVPLGATGDVTTADVLDGNVLDVEANVVSGGGLGERLVVHLDRLDLSGDHGRSKGNHHAGLDETSLDTADGHCSDTADLVHILEGKAKGLVDGALGGLDLVKSLKKVGSLVPGGVLGPVDHVIASPAGDGDELHLLGLVADLGEVGADFSLDFVEAVLGVVDVLVVHLVDSDDDLLDTEGEGKKSVLAGLAVLGNTSLKTTGLGGDDEDSDISLGSSRDHVLDKVTVTGGVNDGEGELGGLELPEGDIDGDTTLALGLQLVEHPGVLEGSLAHFGGFLLELLDGTLVDTSALVDQVTGGRGLTGIDVADDDQVDMLLYFAHFVDKLF